MDSRKCPVDEALFVISGKWKILILWFLKDETLRFGELQKKVKGITQRMLTLHLRKLEKEGIVNRKVYPQIPPKVEYSLTLHGQSLKPLLLDLYDWGCKHQTNN
mgnify:CR=1 FL=1|jgi:DNA-binding HxlR family transcriptional regulator